MKKISIAIVLIFSVALQIKANHDVIVNHSNRSVTILANFISPAPIENAMFQAANLWNFSSGKNICKIPINGKMENYIIHFRLVVNQNPLCDTALNIITVIPDNHHFFKSERMFNNDGEEIVNKTVIVNDGKMIGISNSYQSDINVIAHAMGNVIGLLHKDTQKCCRFNDTYIEAFQLSESVSNLAMNSPGANLNTRKFTEIGETKLQYVAKANR